MEHARWFPHCAYVPQVKGEDYMELVRLSAEQDRLEEVGNVQVKTSLIGEGRGVQPNSYCSDICFYFFRPPNPVKRFSLIFTQ